MEHVKREKITYKQLVINSTEHETRVALLEDGNLAELFIEREDISDIAGNIYKGRVQRVLPGMQAAFVNIGLKQAAFLYAGDVIRENHKDLQKQFENEPDENDLPLLEPVMDAMETNPAEERRKIPIEDLIREGQEIMVHVAKSPIGTKGARVTSHISLPGRFLVLMPNSDHIGISRRIVDETERKRLKNIVTQLRKDTFGYIVRTAAEGVNEEKLLYELNTKSVFYFGLKASLSQKSERIVSLGSYSASKTNSISSWDYALNGDGLNQIKEYPSFLVRESATYALWDKEWIRNFSSSIGLRHDFSSEFGNILNPRIAVVYNPKSFWGAKFLLGRAFRQPGIFELLP